MTNSFCHNIHFFANPHLSGGCFHSGAGAVAQLLILGGTSPSLGSADLDPAIGLGSFLGVVDEVQPL